jgi:hypothetical protein
MIELLKKYRDFFYILIIIFLCLNYYSWKTNPTVPSNQPATFPTSESKPTGTVPCPETGISVIEKAKIAKQLADKNAIIATLSSWLSDKKDPTESLPEWAKDKDIVFLADKTLPPYKGETYVMSTLNVKTGVGGISYKYRDIKYFEFINQASAELGYFVMGPKQGTFQAGVFYTPLRLGNGYIIGGLQFEDNINGIIKFKYEF